ncbi:hypothetical protein [Streptomyces sp. NPDC002790]|uniref:hypothetical protein n=1 Tax=Streptomyces sp. NPDC002790 TaxID=3154431 RepID=UPI00331DBA75
MDVKVTLDLPADDVAFLDAYAASAGLASRAAALHAAVALLRARVTEEQLIEQAKAEAERLAGDPADQAELLALQRFMGVVE